MRDEETTKGVFGSNNALAVIAHFLRAIDANAGWAKHMAALLRDFPASHALTIQSMGVPRDWESFDLWR